MTLTVTSLQGKINLFFSSCPSIAGSILPFFLAFYTAVEFEFLHATVEVTESHGLSRNLTSGLLIFVSFNFLYWHLSNDQQEHSSY